MYDLTIVHLYIILLRSQFIAFPPEKPSPIWNSLSISPNSYKFVVICPIDYKLNKGKNCFYLFIYLSLYIQHQETCLTYSKDSIKNYYVDGWMAAWITEW